MTHSEMSCSGLEHGARHASKGCAPACYAQGQRPIAYALQCTAITMHCGCEHLATGLAHGPKGHPHIASRDGGSMDGRPRDQMMESTIGEKTHSIVLQGAHVRVDTQCERPCTVHVCVRAHAR